MGGVLVETRGAHVLSRRPFGEDCLELQLEDPTGRATAIVWPGAKELAPVMNGQPFDVLYQAEPDGWGERGVKVSVVDVRPLM